MESLSKFPKPIVIWFVVGIGVALVTSVLDIYFWMLGYLPLLIWYLAGAVLIAISLFQCIRSSNRGVLAGIVGLNLLVVAVGFGLSIPLVRGGDRLFEVIHFSLNLKSYETTVAEIVRNPPSDSGYIEHLGAVVDVGPPVRVAFKLPGGLIDNWCGIIYDDTGLVLRSNSFDGNWESWEQQVPSNVRKLFGGDLLWCQEKTEGFFKCCFT